MKKNKISLKEKILFKVRKNPKRAVEIFLSLLFAFGFLLGSLFSFFLFKTRSRSSVTASAEGGYSLGTPTDIYNTYDGVHYALLGHWSLRARYTYEISLLASVDRENGFGERYLCEINFVENYAPGYVTFNLATKENIKSGSIPQGVSVGFESIGERSLPCKQAQRITVNGSFTFGEHNILSNATVKSLEHSVILRVEWTPEANILYPASLLYNNPPFQALASSYRPKTPPEYEIVKTPLPAFILTDSGLLYTEGEYQSAIREASAAARIEGYQSGYSAGVSSGGQNSFKSLFTAVLDAPVEVLTSVLDVELLGFNFKNVFLALLSIALVFAIYRLFSSFGGKS